MLDSESDASSADAMRVQHAHMGRPIDDVFRLIDAAIAGTLAPGDDQWNAASATASSCPVDQQMPLMLAEELFECMAIETCASAFDFIEKRMPQLAHNLQPGRGKGLVLLRLCNELLKRLSKAHDATFCGRILTVLASVYPLAERSGVNQAGHFHVENGRRRDGGVMRAWSYTKARLVHFLCTLPIVRHIVTDYATKDTFDYTPYTRDEFAFKPSAVFPTLQSAVVVPDDSVEGAGMDHAEAAAPANDDDKTTDTIDDKDEMPVTPMSAPPAVKKESPGTIFYSLLWKWQSFAANPEQCITDCKQFRLMQRVCVGTRAYLCISGCSCQY